MNEYHLDIDFFDIETFNKVIWLWSTGVDVITICSLVGTVPDVVNKMIDSVSAHI